MVKKGAPTLKSLEKQLQDVLEGLAAMRAGAQAAGIDLDRPAQAEDVEPPPVETVLEFPVTGPGGGVWFLDQRQINDWALLFPGVDILAECRKALAWVQTNQRKTAKGMPRYLTGWITRAVNRGTAARLSRKVAPNAGAQTEDQRRRVQQRDQVAQRRRELAIETLDTLAGDELRLLEQQARRELIEGGYDNTTTSAQAAEVVRRKMISLLEERQRR